MIEYKIPSFAFFIKELDQLITPLRQVVCRVDKDPDYICNYFIISEDDYALLLLKYPDIKLVDVHDKSTEWR